MTADRWVSSGVAGLDQILQGGFRRNQLYVVAGPAGSGKTTLALQFLLAGAAAGDRALYIGFAETAADLRRVARSHGWSLDGVAVHCLPAQTGLERGDYTLFPASAVELHGLLHDMLDLIGAEEPSRLVIDPISALRSYASDRREYRRLVEGFGRTLTARACTALLVEAAEPGGEPEGLMVADGVVALASEPSAYGPDRRHLRIVKARGVAAPTGAHDYRIATGGVEVYPRVDAALPPSFVRNGAPLLASSVGFGALLGGGLPCGATALITGPPGSGKSSVAMSWAAAAMESGDSVLYLTYDEPLATIVARWGARMGEHVAEGRLLLERTDPAAVSAAEMAHRVGAAAEQLRERLAMVVIDGLDGWLAAAPSPEYWYRLLRQLCAYLNRRGVIVLLLCTARGAAEPCDLEDLSDVTIRTRLIERDAAVRRGIAVAKHRSFKHEDVLRELKLTERGIEIGAPLAIA